MNIHYQRHEYTHPDPEDREAPLLSSGGSDGGMSPGATWTPFEISAGEYAELVATLKTIEPGSLGPQARFGHITFVFDESFDHIQDHVAWLTAVCEKHRDEYHRKLPSQGD